MAFETDDGKLLRWDHMKDIEYSDVPIKMKDGKTEYLSLSFLKPLVHRSSFFPTDYVVPDTCSELLRTVMGDEVEVKVHVDEGLRKSGDFKFLRVEFDGLAAGSFLKGLEDRRLNIYDLALLAECDQLVDVNHGTRHTLTFDIDALMDVRVPEGVAEYSCLHGMLLDMIEESYDDEDVDPELDVDYEEDAISEEEESVVDDEERELLDIVEEYRREAGEDPTRIVGVGVQLMNLARLYMKRERLAEALTRIDESIKTLEGLDLTEGRVRWHLFEALIEKSEVLRMSEGDRVQEETKGLLKKAFKLIPPDADTSGWTIGKQEFFRSALDKLGLSED